MNNTLKNKLKGEYENIRKPVSDDLWKRLENHLDQIPEIPKRKTHWWKLVAVMLLMVSLPFVLMKIDNEQIQDPVKITQNEISEKDTLEFQMNRGDKELKVVTNTNSNEKISEKENPRIKKEIITYNQIHTKIQDSSKFSPKLALTETEKIIDKKIVINTYTSSENNLKMEGNNPKHIKSEDLLFARELRKVNSEHESDNSKLGKIQKNSQPLKSIEILGIKVYSEENK